MPYEMVADGANCAVSTNDFRARIHRGANQIGGTCVELECAGASILLDLGMPLDADEFDPSLMPNIPGLETLDPNLLALVISHGHADHWGLAPQIKPALPLIMGAATKRILQAAAPFVPRPFSPENTLDLSDRVTLKIGPFQITPYLVDHSAYDAYAIVVEANGKRLFYSGDIRAHGRKAGLFEKLIKQPPKGIDVLLMEGSSLGRLDADARFPSESEIEEQFVTEFQTPGFIAVSASAQNIDRIVGLYRACKRTGRTLLLDIYAMEILRATENSHLPGPGWPNLSVYVPEYQRRQIARSKLFELLAPYKAARVYREHISDIAAKAVMLFRPAMLPDIDAAGLWEGARAIWSQWAGYLADGAGAKLKAELAERGVPFEIIHTSGHASIPDLKRLAAAINPAALVPIHTFEADRYAALFSNVVRRNDGEWWAI